MTIEAPDAVPPVAMPRATIDAVLNALLENARQAGADAATIALVPRSGRLDISVADNGPGIAPANSERVFEPFFTTKRSTGGTGLGLAISTSLLRAGGGSLVLEPDAPAGTCFVLTLPIIDA